MEQTIVQIQDYLISNKLDLALGKLRSVFSISNSDGLEIDFAKSSEEARQLLTKGNYEIILSDISRHGKHDEGLMFHEELIGKGIDLPVIFYTGYVDRKRGVSPFAFGIADMPNDLIHLVLDVIERKY